MFNFNRNGKSKYNQQKVNRAITSVSLRVVVAGYIIFVAINVINGTKSETSSIPAWVGSLIGFVFIAASVGFIIYSILTFRKALQAARLDADENTEKAPEEIPSSGAGLSIAEKVKAAQAMIKSDEK